MFDGLVASRPHFVLQAEVGMGKNITEPGDAPPRDCGVTQSHDGWDLFGGLAENLQRSRTTPPDPIKQCRCAFQPSGFKEGEAAHRLGGIQLATH